MTPILGFFSRAAHLRKRAAKWKKKTDQQLKHLSDIAELSKGELRAEYQLTYGSWSNAKHRSSKHGHWATEWNDFCRFLADMGPRTSKEMTLDRIDVTNPNYGPGLCRWADKRLQANNRSSTRTVDIGWGQVPLSDAARALGQQPKMVRERSRRGWNDEEALSGYRDTLIFSDDPRRHWPWPYPGDPARQQRWEELWLRQGGLKRVGDRYSFFINMAENEILKLNGSIGAISSDNRPEAKEKMDEVGATLARWQAALAKARTEYPIWRREVRAHEAKMYEKKKLREGGYLDRHNEEDD